MLYHRNYNFTTNTTIVADQVDEEFNEIETVLGGNIDSDNLVDGCVGVDQLSTNAVSTNKIQDDAVTMTKINNPYYFHAVKTSAQTVSDSVYTDVTWTEQKDPNSNFDGTSYTAPVTGFYHFSANGILRSSANYYTVMQFLVSNGKRPAFANFVGPSHIENGKSISCDIWMTAGESIKVQIYIDTTSGTPDIWGEATWTNSFSGFLISQG